MKDVEMTPVTTREDMAKAAKMADIIWHEYYGSLLKKEQIDYMLDLFLTPEAIGRQIEEGYEYHLIKKEGNVCGFTGICCSGDELFLSKLYVEKGYRKTGAGSYAMKSIIRTARDRGLSKIRLTCNKYNSDSLDIYRYRGFRITDDVVTDIGHGYVMDDYILELDIRKENDMPGYTVVDMEKWPRRDHYRYYTEKFRIQYNMTSDIRVDSILDFCHRRGYRFYPALIYAVTRTINRLDFLRMFRDRDDRLCIWDSVVPNYTIFHDDDKTFSDCWSPYDDDFQTFYDIITSDMEKYGDVKGIKAREKQPGNFYCISCAPWVTFTCFTSRVTDGEPQFFPIITCGKYIEKDGMTMMPVNFMIAHAVCDGYHTGLFFQTLQEELDSLEERLK